MLQLAHIDVTFCRDTVDENRLFRDFELQVESGEFLSIIGSNGSGKTTLLNLICGSLLPDSGDVLLDGVSMLKLKEYQRNRIIGRVFQDPNIGACPELTIRENLALADNKNRRYGLTPALNDNRLDAFRTQLERCHMGLENRLNAKVGSLSGGQRQALALVIATMCDSRLLILDEHTAALDPHTAEDIMQLTDRLVREQQLTTIMVTHNLRYAVEYGSRLLMMDKGQIVLDRRGPEKQATRTEDLLEIFNRISIECGN